MMANHPRLVNKQFNSPINLYSQSNIQEVLEKDMQILTNGGVGINFYNPGVGKPANLQNSAVLRMLEEESRYHNGSMKREGDNKICSEQENIIEKRIPKWPPPENERKRRFRSAFRDVVISGTKRVAWPPIENSGEDGAINQPSSPAQIQPKVLKSQAAPASGITRPPLQPLNISCNTQTSLQSPRSPVQPYSPKGFGESAPPKGWAPVHSPVSPKGYIIKAPSPNYHQQYSVIPTEPQQFYVDQKPIAPCYIPTKITEPPPATITLRPEAPISQAPPPVFTSQPATATLKGGKCLRGDTKWPPENVKKQTEEENRLRLELAKGPVFRPRKVKKDYSNFFAQHALNSSYPGYRAPPGTQYYGASDY